MYIYTSGGGDMSGTGLGAEGSFEAWGFERLEKRVQGAHGGSES